MLKCLHNSGDLLFRYLKQLKNLELPLFHVLLVFRGQIREFHKREKYLHFVEKRTFCKFYFFLLNVCTSTFH